MPEWCTGIPVLAHWVAIAKFCMATIGFAFFCVCVCMCVCMCVRARVCVDVCVGGWTASPGIHLTAG